jgi:hypothetical protein
MSLNYFTGCNNIAQAGHKNPLSDTGLTALGLLETEPSANEGGLTPKGQGKGNTYTRIRTKVYSKTGDTGGKNYTHGCKPGNSNTRASHLKGKYNLGHMWKYRKCLKKTLDDAKGTTANAGVRNMFTNKGAGHTGTKHSKPAAAQQVYFPMDQAK